MDRGCTKQAVLDRRHGRRPPGFASRQIAPFRAMHVARHGPALDKIARRHSRDGARHIAVKARLATEPFIDRDVVDRHLVDLRNVRRAGPVHRPIHIARTEWVPGDTGPAANAHAPVGAACADEGDQCRRIARAWHIRARHPAPAVADMRPAAIVKRREPPRLVVNPGPAPRRDPGPVARAVRRPTGFHHAREPDSPITRVFLPVAVVIQRGVASHLSRHITR